MTSEQVLNLWRSSDPTPAETPALGRDLDADLVVIGGGFTGLAAALEGVRIGARVVVLEANTIGHGGSGRNVGLVNAGLWLPPDQIIAQLGQQAGTRLINALAVAPDAVFQLIDRFGISCEATRNGTLHLAHAPAGAKELESRYRQGNRFGAPLQLLDSNQTRARIGSDAFCGALFDPRAGTVQPLGYCRGLARAAREQGAQIFERTTAQDIRHAGDVWAVTTASGQTVRAKHLLQATNGYVSGVAGLPKPAFVPVHYSQYATAPLSPEDRANILPGGEGCWDTGLVMTSIRLDLDGRLILGGIGNRSGLAQAIHDRWAARKLAQIFPALAGRPFEYKWEGTIAMTADHLPKIVTIGPRALSVFGYSGRGIGPGTVFGIGSAQALLNDNAGALPLGIVDHHNEHFQTVRAAYYETGAATMHALSPAPFARPTP